MNDLTWSFNRSQNSLFLSEKYQSDFVLFTEIMENTADEMSDSSSTNIPIRNLYMVSVEPLVSSR